MICTSGFVGDFLFFHIMALFIYDQFVLEVRQKLQGLRSCWIIYNAANFIFRQQTITVTVLGSSIRRVTTHPAAIEHVRHNGRDSNQILPDDKDQQVLIVSCAPGSRSLFIFIHHYGSR